MTGPDRTRPPQPGRTVTAPATQFEGKETNFGLRLALARRSLVPLVELELLLPAGGDRNPSHRPGLSQLVASLLDEGTARRSGPEISAELERRGGALGTGSDWNAASIRLSLPSSAIEFGLDLLAELLFEPSFPEPDLERLRRQFLAELGRRSDQPSLLAEDAFADGLYRGTAYGEPLLGTIASIGAILREEIIDFHARHYLVGEARLVVAGDFESESLAELVASRFSRAQAHLPEPGPQIAARDTVGRRIVLIDRPDAAQTELRVGHPGIPRRHPDRVALGFLSAILGGKFTSRVNLNLRERLGITYGVSSRLSDRRSPGPFSMACAVENASVGVGARELLAEMRRLRVEAVSLQEIEETRNYLIGVFPYGLQTIEGLASRLRDIALFDLPLDHPRRVLDEYRTIDATRLTEVACAHLRPDEALIVAVGPAAQLEEQLKGIAPLEIRRADKIG